MKVYEGMFLFDPALSSNWSEAEVEINRLMERADAKLLGIKNWDERKLAYPIGGHKRGLYALTYFEAAADKLPGIERDVQLSEKCLRALLLRKDKMTPELIQRSLDADPPKPVSRYEDRGPRGDARRGGNGPRGGPRSETREAKGPPRTTEADTKKDADAAAPVTDGPAPTEQAAPTPAPAPKPSDVKPESGDQKTED
ncbi:MAG: 30S ribosomal protein S6 [Phycisphaerae bacterium]